MLSTFQKLIRFLSGGSGSKPKPVKRPRRQSYALSFEQLEDRITPVVIGNGLATSVVGFFSADVQNGGLVQTAPGTYQGQSGTIFPNVDFVYHYSGYIETTTSPASQLASTSIDSPVALTGPNSTSSSGHFTGSLGNQINWTVSSSLLPNSTELVSTTTFAATSGTLGSLRFSNYLDEDVFSAGNDLLNPRGTPGQNSFVIGYLDSVERVGFGEAGILEAGPGLVNATYDGWAGGTYSDVLARIGNKTQTYSSAGVIGDGLAPGVVDPALGTIYGPADVGSAMSWVITPTATSAVITTKLVIFATDAGAPPPSPTPPSPTPPPSPPPSAPAQQPNLIVLAMLDVNPALGQQSAALEQHGTATGIPSNARSPFLPGTVNPALTLVYGLTPIAKETFANTTTSGLPTFTGSRPMETHYNSGGGNNSLLQATPTPTPGMPSSSETMGYSLPSSQDAEGSADGLIAMFSANFTDDLFLAEDNQNDDLVDDPFEVIAALDADRLLVADNDRPGIDSAGALAAALLLGNGAYHSLQQRLTNCLRHEELGGVHSRKTKVKRRVLKKWKSRLARQQKLTGKRQG